MTTDQTIDGVSREVLSDAFDELPDWNTPAATKLQALLDAPACSACNDTGRMHEPGCEPGACTACLEKPAAQPHDDQPASDHQFYTAQLQARAAKVLGLDPENTSWFEIIGEMEKAAAQHQGEPVYMIRSHGSCCWEEMRGESLEMCQAQSGEYEVRKLYTEQPAPVAVAMPERAVLRDIIAQAIGGDAYDCTRVWSAWGVGTMSDDDFIPIVDQEERLYEIADACLDELTRLNTKSR